MLSLKNIEIKYQENAVIENLSLDFNEQETTVIVGPSGAGKSTLLRTLNLLNFPSQGEIKFGDYHLAFPKKYPKKMLNE